MQIARSPISRPDTLATAIPDYRTPEQLDRMALFMSGRDFNHTGGWKFAAIKSNRRYLQAGNDLVLLKETLKAQAAALEAKDVLIKSLSDNLTLAQNPPIYLESAAARSFRFTQDSTYRPGDPRRDLRMRLDPDVCRHTLTYLSGTARQCGLCFQINPLFLPSSASRLPRRGMIADGGYADATGQSIPSPRLTTYDPTPEARAASDQALRRIADEPAPGRIAD